MSPILRKKVVRLCRRFPEEVAIILLNTIFPWFQSLDVRKMYKRLDDDTAKGSIGVMFSHDGDAWIDVYSEPDPEDPGTHRFRVPFIGGGGSPRTRQALILLALAIKLDNEQNPSKRPRE